MIISGSVIAHKLLADNVEIDDNVSCELPSIEFDTTEVKGAGILGTVDMPSPAQIKPMSYKISSRSINKKTTALAKTGKQSLELRFARDVVQSDGTVIPGSTKIFITGICKKYEPGKVEQGSTMDGSLEFEVIRYRQVIEGVETLLIDKFAYQYVVNGVDYMAAIRAILG
jgi:Phage tail tube protein FII